MSAQSTAARDAMEVRERVFRMSYPDYAERFLKIRTKTQGVQPFAMNVGQLYLHRKIEIQMQTRGFARTVMLKARQWGGSTYIQGRSYWKVAARGARGMRSFIQTHQQDASDALFEMTHRFHTQLDPRIRPLAPRPSLKRLNFPLLDSSYAVATAGSKGVGRSQTNQFFHGSEVAYWPDAEKHLSGALQTVPPRGIDTEIYLESTGNGMGNPFHTAYSNARAGLGEYEAVFVPWFWFDEYRAPVSDLDMTNEDIDYMELWGLDLEQMQFRQSKAIEFGGGEAGRIKFGIEYPATPEDAFSQNITGGYIQAKFIIMARRKPAYMASRFGPKILCIDPSWTGSDRFVCWIRHGRYAVRVGRWTGLRSGQSIAKVKLIAEQYQPDVVTMDVGGLGGPIFDQLSEVLDPTIMMIPVLGGEQADEPERWRNKRAENWGRMLEWFTDPIGPCIDDALSKDDDERAKAFDEIQGDLTCVLTDWDNQNRPTVESKKKLLTHSPSPDNAESLVTSFVYKFGPDWKRQVETEIEHAKRPINWRAT